MAVGIADAGVGGRAEGAEPPETLRVRLFGALELDRGGRPLPAFATRKARSLFCYLLLHARRLHPRDVLAGTFWGEQPDAVARRHLRAELWRVRQVLACAEGALELRADEHRVGLALDRGVRVDIAEFEAALAASAGRPGEALAPAEARRLEEAVALVRGDLLEEVYEDWCAHERERLRALALDALMRLTWHHLHHGDWAAALRHGQRLVAADPLREPVHAALMRCHLAAGDRAAALRQYEGCARLLREELDVAPLPETVALYEQIRAGAPLPLSGDPAVPPAGPTDTLERLRAAERDLRRARRYLRRGLHALRALGAESLGS